MKSLAERLTNIWTSARFSATRAPCRVTIPLQHVENSGERLGLKFRPHEHYFQVRINEMYLQHSREWLSKYDPLVLCVSEFNYDREAQVVPFVVSSTAMERYGNTIPTGMILSDTRVAGLYPYCGGRLTVSVILCRVQRGNYARKLLQLVESTSSVLDFGTALSTYVKIGSVVLDGIEALLGAGDTEPLMGLRKELDPDAGDALSPSYFALVDIPESELDARKLWVRDNRLFYGEAIRKCDPFRSADFVLYSITQTGERSDISTLPFYPLWERVIKEATTPKQDDWQSAKANMVSLYQTLMLSPDLTKPQALQLAGQYVAEMKRLHDRAVEMAELGDHIDSGQGMDQTLGASLQILQM